MKTVTVRVALDEDLLRTVDRAARAAAMNRSELVREALRVHLRRLTTLAKEARDRAGYTRRPDRSDDSSDWERVAVWPAE